MKFARLALPLCLLAPLGAATSETTVVVTPPPGASAASRNDPAELAQLRAKAERGNAIAQYNLGLAYAQGRQVARDLVEAHVWLTLAAEGGSTGKELDATRSQMTPEQQAEARERLDVLRQSNPFLRSTLPTGPTAKTPPPAFSPSVAALPEEPAHQLATALARAEAQAKEAQAHVADQTAELNAVRAALATARTGLDEATAARTASAAALADANATLERERAARIEAQFELTKVRTRLEELTVRAKAPAEPSPADTERAKKLIEELETTRRELAAVKAQAATDAATAGQTLAAVQEKLATAQAESSQRNQVDAGARADLEKARRAAAEAETKLAQATEELATLRNQSAALRDIESRARALEAEKAALATRTTELDAQLAAANQVLATRAGPTRPSAGLASPSRAPVPAATEASIPVASTPPPAPAPRQHVIAAGDTLSGISRRYYGTPNRWAEILTANREVIRDERNMVVGRTLKIP